MIHLKSTKILINLPINAIPSVDLDQIDILVGTDVTGCLGILSCCKRLQKKIKIYLTDPIKEFIQFYFLELMNESKLQTLQSPLSSTQNSLSSGLFGSIDSYKNIRQFLKKIHSVKFGQRINYFNLFTLVALNSGYEVGGCYWRIECNQINICLIGNSSDSSLGKDGSFGDLLAPFDMAGLSKADCLVVLRGPSKISFSKTDYHESIVRAVGRISSMLGEKNISTKTVIIPSSFVDRVFFDLLEAFTKFCPRLHICIVGNTAKSILQSMGILTEWFHENLQEIVQIHAKKPLKFMYSPMLHFYDEFNQSFGEELTNNVTSSFVLFCPQSPCKLPNGSLEIIENFFPESKSKVVILKNQNESVEYCGGERREEFLIDQSLSLKSLSDIVTHCCQLNPKLHVINVSFEYQYFPAPHFVHQLSAQNESVELPLTNLTSFGYIDKSVTIILINF